MLLVALTFRRLVVSNHNLAADIIIVVLLFLNANLNTNLFWYVILCLVISKKYTSREQPLL